MVQESFEYKEYSVSMWLSSAKGIRAKSVQVQYVILEVHWVLTSKKAF